MGEQRKSYSAEFKMEALRLLETSGKCASEIERELGIGDGCLRQWRSKLAADGKDAFPGHGRVSADQEELVRLRREAMLGSHPLRCVTQVMRVLSAYRSQDLHTVLELHTSSDQGNEVGRIHLAPTFFRGWG